MTGNDHDDLLECSKKATSTENIKSICAEQCEA